MPRPRFIRQTTIDLLSDTPSPSPEDSLIDTAIHDLDDGYDNEGDLIDLETDFEGWSPLPVPVAASGFVDKGVKAGKGSDDDENGERNEGEEEDKDEEVDKEEEEDKDEYEDETMDFEECDDFSSTKTPSDHIVMYSQEPDTPPLGSAEMSGVERELSEGIQLFDESEERVSLPEGEGEDGIDTVTVIYDPHVRVDASLMDEVEDEPILEPPQNEFNKDTPNKATHPFQPHQDRSSISLSPIKEKTSPEFGSELSLNENLAEALAAGDLPIVDNVMKELQDEFDSMFTLSRVQSVSKAAEDSEVEDVTAIFKPLGPEKSIESSTSTGTEQSSMEVDQEVGVIKDQPIEADSRKMESFPSFDGTIDAQEQISGDSKTFGHKLSTISKNPIVQEEKVLDPRTNSWIILPTNRAEKKKIILSVFLHHTAALFPTTLRITHANTFTPTSPIPHAIWSSLFTPYETARLLKAQGEKLHVAAVARTKTVLEEWRLSTGFPAVPEVYPENGQAATISSSNNGKELDLARSMLKTRTAKTQRWIGYIFELGGGGKVNVLDDETYLGMIESVLGLVAEVFRYPMSVGDEHALLKKTRGALRDVVVDELGGLMEGLRLG